MQELNIAENIVQLRHKKKVTQEELATFLGVTKASVSKWETKQSYPDILLLPQIAAYFDVGIDALLGYEPQLSKEQIKKLYHELAQDFSELPFEEVMDHCRSLVKQYYACYEFLFLISVLWLNHFMLAEEGEPRQAILEEILELLAHIENSCTKVEICNNVIAIKAMIHLQLQHLEEVIELLEPLHDPLYLDIKNPLYLIQAYAGKGDLQKAEMYNQVAVYDDVSNLLAHMMSLFQLHMQDPIYCEKTMERLEGILSLFEIDTLNPNTASQYYYQSAVYYCTLQQDEQALSYLQRFMKACDTLMDQDIRLHGDAYFTYLEEWFEQYPLGVDGVRSKKLILETIQQALENPVFTSLQNNPTYIQMVDHIKRKRANLL